MRHPSSYSAANPGSTSALSRREGNAHACDDAALESHEPAPLVFDLHADLSETTNLNETYPDVLAAIAANFSAWNASVQLSRATESFCDDA